MLAILDSIFQYDDPKYHLQTRAEHTGFETTWRALHKRGLVDKKGRLTFAGREIVDPEGAAQIARFDDFGEDRGQVIDRA